MRNFRTLGVSLLAALIATAALAVVTLPPVSVIGILKNRWQLDQMMLWTDLQAQMKSEYANYIRGDLLSDDPMIASNNADARCNSWTAQKTGNTNSQSDAAFKKAAATLVLNQLKGSAQQGGFPSGGFQNYFDQMKRATYVDSNGVEMTAKTMTIIWSDGSSTMFSVFGSTAASSYIRDPIKSDPTPVGQGNLCPMIG